MPPSTSTSTAGQAGNKNVEEGSDGSDNALEDGGDTVNDGHKASANGVKEAFNA